MITIIVNVEVNTDKVFEFIQATQKSQEETLKEKGCYRYEIFRDTDKESKFVLIEEYENMTAIAEHKDTNHFKEWKEVVDPITSRKSVKHHRINKF